MRSDVAESPLVLLSKASQKRVEAARAALRAAEEELSNALTQQDSVAVVLEEHGVERWKKAVDDGEVMVRDVRSAATSTKIMLSMISALQEGVSHSTEDHTNADVVDEAVCTPLPSSPPPPGIKIFVDDDCRDPGIIDVLAKVRMLGCRVIVMRSL